MKNFLFAFSIALLLPLTAHAHAIVGDRVFPATIAIDDPGVNDELDTHFGRTNSPDGWTSDGGAEFDKRLTDDFGLSVSDDWIDQSGRSGLDNIDLGAKYVFFKNEPHETMISAGLDWEVQGTGAKRIADDFSTLTPALFFGKGLGDLPDSAWYLRPFAVTGTLGLAVPTERTTLDGDDATHNPNAVEWGGTLQYSVPYLEQHVKDVGITGFAATAVPVVEFAMETPTGGQTTGTVNPGVLFMGTDMQLGLEAVVPVNHASGDRVGAIVQLHFYLDNIFPDTMRPIW